MAQLQDLKDQCQALGLPTWGSIPQLQARLDKARAEAAPPAGGGGDDPLERLQGDEGDGGAADAGPETPGSGPALRGDETAAEDGPADPQTLAQSPVGRREYVRKYPTHGPPDERTHAELCAAIRDDAIAEGHTPRGGGQRVRTVHEDGRRFEEYSITLRRE